jgi:hypothetical protein
MREMYLRFVLAYLVLAAQISVAQAAQTDRRLEIFLEKYDALNGRTPSLAHAKSPFFPYHGKNFEEGLDAVKLQSLHGAQKNGNCILVHKLVLEGFLGLFPFLKPAFSDSDRGIYLRGMILTDDRPVLRRCWDHRKMKKLLTLYPLEELLPVDFAKKSLGHSSDLLDPKVPRRALRGFGIRAFCDDYPPSIAELRAIANRNGGMALTEQEGLYLLERARLHGLGKGEYLTTFARFKDHFNPNANLSRLRAASRSYRLADIDFKVEGYWQSRCRDKRRYRQNKAQR